MARALTHAARSLKVIPYPNNKFPAISGAMPHQLMMMMSLALDLERTTKFQNKKVYYYYFPRVIDAISATHDGYFA